MSELIISENIVIDDIEFVIAKIEERTGLTGIEKQDIEDFIKNESSTLFYVDDKLNTKMEEDKSSRYLWVDTGFEEDGKPIFVSMINNYGYYEGHFTGHYEFLAQGMMNYNPANYKPINDNIYKFETKYEQKASKRTTKHLNSKFRKSVKTAEPVSGSEKTILSVEEEASAPAATVNTYAYGNAPIDMAYHIRKQLLVDNWKSLSGIDRYIKIIGARLWQIVEQGKSEYYVLNRTRSAIINTGMLDKFGEDIRIMYRVNLTRKTYEAYKLIESKNDFLENDFSKDQTTIHLKPINFFDGEEVFHATIDDFDINTRSLTHIINERRSRFPESIQNIPDDNLAARVKSALELGLKLAARDKTYVKPSFSGKYRGIAWMMPLHINSGFAEEPELVLVINKVGEFYEIKTVLPYDDEIRDRITAMTLYTKLW